MSRGMRITDISELVGLRILHTVSGYGAGQISDAYLTIDNEIYVIIAFDNGRKANPFSLVPCMRAGLILLENNDYSIDRLNQIIQKKGADSKELIAAALKCLEEEEQLKLEEEKRKREALQEALRQAEQRRIEFEEQQRIRAERRRLEIERRQMLLQKEIAEQRKKQEEQEKSRRLLEEKKKAEIAALLAKKNDLIERIISAFESDYLSAESFYLANNSDQLLTDDEFAQLQENYTAGWFSTHKLFAQSPDKDQLAAIGATRQNVEVIARAGSGKTTTIVNRFRFLVDHCKVDPSSILMLAFNRNAVQEMRDRTEKILTASGSTDSRRPHILTFHALAHSIVRPQEKLIFDEGDHGSNELSRTIQAIIDKRIKDILWGARIRRLMLEYFKNDWEKIEKGGYHLSKEEQLIYRRSLQNQSLNGDYVKSYGEKLIANILFEHGIKYYYESTIRWADGIYRPDFTVKLPGKKFLIIEYFGMAGDPDYDEQIERKREFWEKRENSTLVELYREDIAQGEEHVASFLCEILSANRMQFKKLTEDEIWKRIKDRAVDSFTKAVVTFIGRCRKKELSISALREQIIEYDPQDDIEKQFLKIAFSIYKEYLDTLSKNNQEDFDGLISRACTCIENGQTDFDKGALRGNLKDLRFIMVDEYQDFSYLFDKLLETVRSVCPQACVFCVGDDWQAINAFAGSDVSYFQDFDHRYKDAQRCYVRTNYRSSKGIVTAGCNLMNDGSESSSVRANSATEGTVKTGYYDLFVPSIEEQNVFQSDLLTPAVLRLVSHFLRQGKSVVLLFRTNDRLPINVKIPEEIKGKQRDRFTTYLKSFFPPDVRSRIHSSTTHQYKGKEEDAVIIMDAMASFYPLIHPTWIFMRVFGDTLEKLVEDERRLFYVAVTRAKSDLIILTTINDESPFLSQLGAIGTLHWDRLPAFDTGERKARIEVASQEKYGSAPTISIKEQLKSSGFSYHPKTHSWFRSCASENVDILEVINEPWAATANHIQVALYNSNGECAKKLEIEDGDVTVL